MGAVSFNYSHTILTRKGKNNVSKPCPDSEKIQKTSAYGNAFKKLKKVLNPWFLGCYLKYSHDVKLVCLHATQDIVCVCPRSLGLSSSVCFIEKNPLRTTSSSLAMKNGAAQAFLFIYFFLNHTFCYQEIREGGPLLVLSGFCTGVVIFTEAMQHTEPRKLCFFFSSPNFSHKQTLCKLRYTSRALK